MIFLSNVRHPDVGQVRAAWERYVGSEDLAPGTLRPYVLRAWDRARASGCNPRLGRADLLGERETQGALSGQFARQADTWRVLALERSGPPQPEPLELADIVQDLLDLLATEARVLGLQFEWAAAERVRVLDDRQVLTRRLLGALLSALQAAASGSTLVVEVGVAAGLGCAAIKERFTDGRMGQGSTVESVRAV